MSPETSLLLREREPEAVAWGVTEHLMATVADALHVANWQRAGGKKKDRPRPIPRPGVKPDTHVFKGTPVSIEEIDDWLGWTPTVTATDL